MELEVINYIKIERIIVLRNNNKTIFRSTIPNDIQNKLGILSRTNKPLGEIPEFITSNNINQFITTDLSGKTSIPLTSCQDDDDNLLYEYSFCIKLF